jgi:hypothetical protein
MMQDLKRRLLQNTAQSILLDMYSTPTSHPRPHWPFPSLPFYLFFFSSTFGGGLIWDAFGASLGFGVAFAPLIRSIRWSPVFLPYNMSAPVHSPYTNNHTFSASTSHPLPNFARNAASFPASSSSTFSSFCELGFHSGALRMSLALL